jgi:hypothetical protein
MADGQPLKGARENWVVPPGLRSFFPPFPALKRWAKLVRPSGAYSKADQVREWDEFASI